MHKLKNIIKQQYVLIYGDRSPIWDTTIGSYYNRDSATSEMAIDVLDDTWCYIFATESIYYWKYGFKQHFDFNHVYESRIII